MSVLKASGVYRGRLSGAVVRRLTAATPDNGGRFPLHVVPESDNKKIGLSAATYRPVLGAGGESSCPLSCAYNPLGSGEFAGKCYALKYPVSLWQSRSAARFDELDKVLLGRSVLLRHHVSGDLGDGASLDEGYLEYLFAWHRFVPAGVCRGWIYTHMGSGIVSSGVTPSDVPDSLRVLFSVDSVQEAEHFSSLGWQVALSGGALPLARGARRAVNGVLCPNTLQAAAKVPRDDRLTCADCQLCMPASSVRPIVFPLH